MAKFLKNIFGFVMSKMIIEDGDIIMNILMVSDYHKSP